MGGALVVGALCCWEKRRQIFFQVRKGARFIAAGIGSLGAVFAKSYSGSRNRKPNKDQVESYKNKDQDTYKPNYYSIQPNAINTQVDRNQGMQTLNCNYYPDVDPMKLQRQRQRYQQAQAGRVNFGFQGGMNQHSYMQERSRRMQMRQNRYYDQRILQVRSIRLTVA